MKTPLVSVIMPTYNRGNLLPRAVNSILSQIFTDWELIIIDDGSDDDTQGIVKQYMTRDSRIRYHRQQHLGYAAAINAGCRLAKGKFIAFQDDDDISLPDRFELEVKELNSDPELELVYGLVKWVDNRGRTLRYFPDMLKKGDFRGSVKKGFSVNLWDGCKVPCVTIMMRKRHFPANGEIFESKMLRKSQDWLHVLELAYEYRIVGLSRVLVEVNRDLSRQTMMHDKIGVLESYRKVLDLAKARIGPKMSLLERWNHFRKAWGYQYLLEALILGGWQGLCKLLLALIYRPIQPKAWELLLRYLRFPIRFLKVKTLTRSYLNE